MKRRLLWYPLLVVATAILTALVMSRQSCSGSSREEVVFRGEQRALRDAGFLVAEPVEDLHPALSRFISENENLRSELERLQRAAPSARPVALLRARTAPAPVEASIAAGKEVAPCVVAAGDALGIEVDVVASRTERGNIIVAGDAAAIRLSDPPLTIVRAPFSAELSSVTVEAKDSVPPERGWAVGPWGLLHPEGWSLGVVAASPELRLPRMRWGVEIHGAAGAGPAGPAIAIGFLVRR